MMADSHKAARATEKRAEAEQKERTKIKKEQRIGELESRSQQKEATAAGFLLGAQDVNDVRGARLRHLQAKKAKDEVKTLNDEVKKLETEINELHSDADKLAAEAASSDN